MASPLPQGRLAVLQTYKLLQCVREENKPQIKKMVELGVPNLINLVDPGDGNSALHLAALDNNAGMCSFLLSLKAYPDTQDKNGCSPVMKAAELGHDNIVAVFAKAGANMKVVDNEGKGILFYCIHSTKRHLRCVQIALSHGADVNNCSVSGRPIFVLACEQALTCKPICMNILENGADPNATDQVTGHTALMEAAKSGDAELVRAILLKGGNVNALDKRRNHAAHFAALGGFFEVIRVLSAYSADLGVVNMDGNTPLHLAAKGGFADCCKFLSQRGCNPKLKNLELMTPRQVAKENGHKAAMKDLRKAERLSNKYSKPGVKNPNELWAIRLYDWALEHEEKLRIAFQIEEENDAVAKDVFASVLHDHGAPVEHEGLKQIISTLDKSNQGSVNVLDLFKGNKYLQKAFLISSYGAKKKKKRKGRKGKKKGKFSIPMPICVVPQDLIHRREDGGPPHFMIENYQPFTDFSRFDRDHVPLHPIEDDSAWYLDQPDKSYTHINYCVKSGDFESIKLAFSQGVPVNVQDQFYKTPLMCACAHGNYEIAKYLIKMGANVNACDQFKWTPLHHACHAGQLDIIELLIEAGAEVDAIAINGSTPLMRAIESCRMSCVEYLLKAGAKIQVQNKKEQNALDIAKAYADFRIIQLLQEKFDALPKPKEKSKSKGKVGPRPKSTSSTLKSKQSPIPTLSPSTPATVEKLESLNDSVIYQNTRIANGAMKKVDITFVPKTVWGDQPTTRDLIKRKEERRMRFSSEVDFEDFTMPFEKNIMKKSLELGGPD
ncbi:ankyrin repeat and EF-hand domain-containing protein 1 [Polypterus senegalus]|uniref:ankyrin repeat and EF-hand domain-containing protein 1 n=1 Tax=Polypterus senegalus TaxID=55291 RepID=UPI001962EE7A|nr:ankyrin repeat and EF-hand domain-containing protein 1 [Polypterus senegalus]